MEEPAAGDEPMQICWQLDVEDLIFPKLNTDEDDSPITLLRFVRLFRQYLENPPVRVDVLLQAALLGRKERLWFIELDGDPNLILDRITDEANRSDQWQALKNKVLREELLHPDMEEHIEIFKEVASHERWDLQSDKTRMLFARTIPNLNVVYTCVLDENFELVSFDKLEKAALASVAIMRILRKNGKVNSAETDDGCEEEEVADPEKRKKKKKSVVCKRSGQRGHWAAECRAPHPIHCKRCGKTGHVAEKCRAPHPMPRSARDPNVKS